LSRIAAPGSVTSGSATTVSTGQYSGLRSHRVPASSAHDALRICHSCPLARTIVLHFGQPVCIERVCDRGARFSGLTSRLGFSPAGRFIWCCGASITCHRRMLRVLGLQPIRRSARRDEAGLGAADASRQQPREMVLTQVQRRFPDVIASRSKA